jgi:hypothetical protein
MTKHLSIILALFILLVQNMVHAQENVGIGTLTPASRLDVQGNASSSPLTIVNSKANYAGTIDIKAFEGFSVTADGFGIGGKFTGGYRGADALATGGAYTGTTYGVFGMSNGTAGTRVGVYGTAIGGANNYGVWGNVNGGANFYGVYGQNTNLSGYAGYFNGRGHFTQELRADKNLVVNDTTWTGKIWGPSGPLQISSLSDLTFRIDRNNNGAISAFFELFNGSGNLIYWINELGTGRISGSYYVDGNLGVGTNTPTTRFQILGGSDVSLTTNGFAQFGATNGWNLILDDNEIMARNNGLANDLLIQQDAGNILMCGLEQGRVGIGVQLAANLPTGYMLAVDGKIIGEELRIQNSNNWPDYVFGEHYELMSLDELKNSISIHKHLPNIPSAEVVQQEGILVGDMQKRMMEKIEELTLYILELNDVNKQQQSEIEQLKSLLSDLKEK